MAREPERWTILGRILRKGGKFRIEENATGKKVIAGPIEATASGNILMQARATGQIASLAAARQIAGNSFELKQYQPKDTLLWQQRYDNAKALF